MINSRNSPSIASSANPRLPIKPTPASVGRRGGGAGEPPSHAVPPPVHLAEPWLLGNRDVARLLGIGRTKAFQLIASGDLPVVRIGRCVRVPRTALELWITAQSAAAREDRELGGRRKPSRKWGAPHT